MKKEAPGRSIVHADLRNKEYVEWTKFLNEADSWNREQIEEYQSGEIRRIVKFAYENAKAYRELYNNASVKPDMVEPLTDITSLPFVEKEMIRDRLEDFSVDIKGRTYITTGGSTGIPFGFYRDRAAFAKELASKAHQYYRVGWKEGDRQLVLRGLPISTKNHMQYYPRFNELRCSSYHLVPEWMDRYREKAFEYQPEWLRCYPSSGYIFAQFLKNENKDFPPIKGILCASENLYDYQKELICKTFGARVFSHYGHYEMAVLAGYCEHEDTYHVLPQYGYAELIDARGEVVTLPGQVGEIVATSFITHATPFVRYRTGDLAVLKSWECASCGRPYQIWEKIEGRLQEFIVTGSGRYISMTAINMHDDVFDHIKQFQFYQENKGKLLFKYIPKSSCNSEILEITKRRLLFKLGDDVELEMKPVDDIAPSKRGKHRFLIQKMELDIPHD